MGGDMALVSPSSRPALEALTPEDRPNVEALVTEDDMPVDNIFSEKQQRLLVESLYSSWAGPGEGRPFVALANVGLFYAVHRPPFVPDVLLSLDVHIPPDVWVKSHRSYFIWEYGKPPDVLIEIVSNQKGEEAERKLRDYARIGIDYYVIFDPSEQLGMGPLRIYRQHYGVYRQADSGALPTVGLEVRLWPGAYEGLEQTWLRWYDHEGRLILTGAERAEQERQHAEQERQRVERLTAQLRALGVEPDEQC
jgi:Uma2 family endonuclease